MVARMSASLLMVEHAAEIFSQNRWKEHPCRRRTSETAIREWVQRELATGRVTIAKIKRERSSEPASAVPHPDAIRPSDEPPALP